MRDDLTNVRRLCDLALAPREYSVEDKVGIGQYCADLLARLARETSPQAQPK